jgi:hypothetical protein
MGWASGGDLASSIIETVKEYVKSKATRTHIYVDIIKALESNDWDTQDECEGQDPAFDEAMRINHPDWDGYGNK